MSMEFILDNVSLPLELVLLFAVLSLTLKSFRWPLSGLLSWILFEILLLSFVMVFRSTASIWYIGKTLTFSGVLFFGMSEAFSSFTFSVSTTMVFALNLSSKFETNIFRWWMVYFHGLIFCLPKNSIIVFN